MSSLDEIKGAVKGSSGPGGTRLSTKELWELGRRIEIMVPVVDPQVEWKGGSGGQRAVVFHTFVTEVSDPETGKELGAVSGGTRCVVLTHEDYKGQWQISHDDLWYAFVEGLKTVGPVPVVPRPEPEPEPEIIKVAKDQEVAKPVEVELPPELVYESPPDEELVDDVVFFEITTYQGYALGAVHWYGKLKPWKGAVVELQDTLTTAQARKLSDDNTFTWKEGDITTRWDSKERLEQFGIDTYKEHFPGAKVLILGRAATIQAQAVLRGFDPGIRAKLNTLYLECEDLGWWDVRENEPGVEILNDEWKELFNKAIGQEIYR